MIKHIVRSCRDAIVVTITLQPGEPIKHRVLEYKKNYYIILNQTNSTS